MIILILFVHKNVKSVCLLNALSISYYLFSFSQFIRWFTTKCNGSQIQIYIYMKIIYTCMYIWNVLLTLVFWKE